MWKTSDGRIHKIKRHDAFSFNLPVITASHLQMHNAAMRCKCCPPRFIPRPRRLSVCTRICQCCSLAFTCLASSSSSLLGKKETDSTDTSNKARTLAEGNLGMLQRGANASHVFRLILVERNRHVITCCTKVLWLKEVLDDVYKSYGWKCFSSHSGLVVL